MASSSSFSQQEYTIIEEKNAEMVSLNNGGKPILRNAHFLKPSFPQTLLSKPPNYSQTVTKPISSILKYSTKLQFNGWRNHSMKNWNSWVEKMSTLHEQTWRKACIYDPIMVSKLEIPKCYASLFTFAEKWCIESSSFVLNWGEISVTLEDVVVLGGFSLIGECVFGEFCGEKMVEIEEELRVQRLKMCRSSSKKASQQQWMEMWMDNGSEIEHEAFLALWLSRYVLPANDMGTINKNVLRIAVVLARGTRIALAPVVLASIYRDLRFLKGKIEILRNVGDDECDNVGGVKLWAPLQLLQAWIWERFTGLSPKPNCVVNGLRLERWHKVKVLKNDNVGEIVDSAGESFRWRPYSKALSNWLFSPRLYPEKGEWVDVGGEVGLDVESYVRCVRSCELVGFESDCVERYLPHRVSMQFGLDQDIPYDATPWFGDNKMTAWTDYHRSIVDLRVYVPSKHFDSDVTTRYLEWWRKHDTKKEMSDVLRIKKEINEADVPPGFDPIGKNVALNDLCDPPASKRSKGSTRHVSSVTNSSEANMSSHLTKQVKGAVAENDSDDHLTMPQLLQSKSSKRGNSSSSAYPVIHIDSALSSAEDNEPLQATGTIECTSNDAGCPIGSPLDANKREAGDSSCCMTETPKMDLLDRIGRLQRIVDVFQATKYGSD